VHRTARKTTRKFIVKPLANLFAADSHSASIQPRKQSRSCALNAARCVRRAGKFSNDRTICATAASRLPGESRIPARCRADSANCSAAAARFLAIIDRAAKQDGWIRIAEINRAINLDIRPVSDVTQYGATPFWPTPLMTFAANAGDCKDYAVAKFIALRELGFSAADLRIVIVRASAEYHALTAVHYDSHWFIRDNRTSAIKRDSDSA
jgi:predicted transglutaminase-like cysteine proteinase